MRLPENERETARALLDSVRGSLGARRISRPGAEDLIAYAMPAQAGPFGEDRDGQDVAFSLDDAAMFAMTRLIR